MTEALTPPHDDEAEKALLGACLYWRDAAEWAVDWITPGDFYKPRHAAIFAAVAALWRTGGKVDPVSVWAEMQLHGTHEGSSMADLVSLTVDVPAAGHVRRYGEIIQRHSLARAALALAIDTRQKLYEPGNDPATVVDDLMTNLRQIDSPIMVRDPGDMSARELLAQDYSERSPWVIPDLMRLAHRCMFVGVEGGGRSVLLRQIATCVAYGVHPFTNTRTLVKIPPKKTLVVDLENPEDNVQEWIQRLHDVCAGFVGNDNGLDRLRVLMRGEGLDLRNRAQRAELEDVIRRHQPELVCIGPLYKASEPAHHNETYEQSARGLQDVFDSLRTRYGFALVLEHHAGNEERGKRDMRPEGSSLWRRWGELRWKLIPKSDLEPHTADPPEMYPVKAMRRKPFSGDRVKHAWPDVFRWGDNTQLPWVGYWDDASKAPMVPQRHSDYADEPF